MEFEQIQNLSQVIKIVLGIVIFYFVFRIMRSLNKIEKLLREK